MARNNDVFQVLVTKDNQALLAAGKSITELLPGQIGVFDALTNQSVASLDGVANYFFAVGVDTDGDGITDDVQKSTGSAIQGKNMVFYNMESYQPGSNMIVKLKDYTALCNTEYGIKLELRNAEIYRTQGYNQFTETYTVKTGCCNPADTTDTTGDANEITKQLKINILNDPKGLVTARAVARQALTAATHGVAADLAVGAEVSDADLEALIAYNKTQADSSTYVYTDLEIETLTQKINNFSAINLKYFYPRQTVAIVSKVIGFECTGTLETTQDAVFEQGAGYDLKQLEYMALGWKDSPYRLSTLNGVAFDREYNAVATAHYNQFVLTYDQFSLGAWLEYYNNESTIIAVPTADATTTAALQAILNTALTKTI